MAGRHKIFDIITLTIKAALPLCLFETWTLVKERVQGWMGIKVSPQGNSSTLFPSITLYASPRGQAFYVKKFS